MSTIATPFTAGTAANSASLAATITAAAGDVLFLYSWQYSTANTCNTVTDSLGGTWVKAFGPIQGAAGASNPKLYGWYKINAAAGSTTVTATWSGAAQGLSVVGKISGLAGGGAFDQQVSNTTYTAASFLITAGAFAAFPAGGAAIVGVHVASAQGAPASGWTSAGSYDTYNFERGIAQVTTTSAALTPAWTVSSTPIFVAGAMSFVDLPAPATLSGNVTLDLTLAAGTLASSGSDLAGAVTLDVAIAAGTLGAAPGTITTPPLKNNTATVLANLAGWTVNVYNASTGALVVQKTGLTTSGAGVLTITDAAIIAGTSYSYEPVHSSSGRRLPMGAAA